MGYTPFKLLLRNIGELVCAHEPQKYKKGIENTCTQFLRHILRVFFSVNA